MQSREKNWNLMGRFFLGFIGFTLVFAVCSVLFASAQEKSINPGINEHFEDPDVREFIKMFEGDDRVVYARRHEIIKTLELKPGSSAADIGAGTGFFSFLMAEQVGHEGAVYAVDIAENFVHYIRDTAQRKGMNNVEAIQNTARSALLLEKSVDTVLICDTYHHFEYPVSMLASIWKALKPGGKLVLVDFERIEGKTEDWILRMVRAGKEQFKDEIIAAGFELIDEVPFTPEHYILRFKKKTDNK